MNPIFSTHIHLSHQMYENQWKKQWEKINPTGEKADKMWCIFYHQLPLNPGQRGPKWKWSTAHVSRWLGTFNGTRWRGSLVFGGHWGNWPVVEEASWTWWTVGTCFNDFCLFLEVLFYSCFWKMLFFPHLLISDGWNPPRNIGFERISGILYSLEGY